MGRMNAPLQAFNRGEIGKLALGRVDIDRLRLSAEEVVNWVPQLVGPMSFRPGTIYLGGTNGNLRSYDVPFIFSTKDTAALELTNNAMRIIVGEVPLRRTPTGSTFLAGPMDDTTKWQKTVTANGQVTVALGEMSLDCNAIGEVVRATAPFIPAAGDMLHSFRIRVFQQPVIFRVGPNDGRDEIFRETTLGIGEHSLTFSVPASGCAIQFENTTPGVCKVYGCVLEDGAGDLVIGTPWGEGDLPLVRSEQSGDVVFLTCKGQKPRRVERRSNNSWSLVEFTPDDGPLQAFPAKETSVSCSNPTSFGVGNITIAAKTNIFNLNHVGALFSAFTPGYNLQYPVAGEQSFCPAIRVSGVGVTRQFFYAIEGTFQGTWALQRSLSSEFTGFTTVAFGTAAVLNTAQVFLNDGLDNSVCWYRIGFLEYESGKADIRMSYNGAGRTGVARIYEVLNGSTVRAKVLQPFSSFTNTKDWYFGEWSSDLGWPDAVGLSDGRLCFAGRDRFWTSVSDSYGSFARTLDGSTVGDASAISRSVGYGPVAIINWMLPLTRLILGSEGSEISVRSSALDAPITPAGGVTIKDCSTQGSARVSAVKVDKRGLFVQKSGQKLYQLAYDVNSQDYEPSNMNRLHPDLFLNNPIVRLAVQRQPDTRIHCLRADGTVAVLTFEPRDEVEAWWRVETDGFVEDVCVLPGLVEDRVYYTVRRQVNGQQIRMRERFARQDQARGGEFNRIADCHKLYSGPATATITGLGHLEGRTVCAWGNSKDLGTFTVQGGAVTLPEAVTVACVGLPYEGRFKSAKLAYAAQGGTALNQIKRVVEVGLILANTHAQGLQYGSTYETLDDLPWTENGGEIDLEAVNESYDEQMIEVPGDWNTDERLCLKAAAPRPATVMACSVKVETNG
ncbi:hypothetical protein [uncultured Methylobacterium sp.]|uniref:hypothetical protein n=1 Tax=uncultured Methylobacterium sp. TaxID=157278 RepID=UPI0035CC0C6A